MSGSSTRRLCNCSKYCGNPGKYISLATYNRHAQHCGRDALTPRFHEFLSSLQQNSVSRISKVSGGVKKRAKGKEKSVPNGECIIDVEMDQDVVSLLVPALETHI